ncbi:MAG: PH domain-containing protein [Deltaproteobacteria bacterium]
MEFENPQIYSQDLPDFTEAIPEKLEKNYFWVMFINRLSFVLVTIPAFLISAYFIDFENKKIIFFSGSLLLLLICAFFLISTKKAFNRKSYSIRHNDLIFRRGVLFNRITIVPFNRIQHIELTRGPVENFFNLCSIKFFTAGGSQSDIIIPGLNTETANKIKSFIISKISVHEEY